MSMMRLKRIEELKEMLFNLDKTNNNDCAEKMLDINFRNVYQISTESAMTFEEVVDRIKAIILKNGITVNEAIRNMKDGE